MSVIGRPREFDRDLALESAMRLFWRKGFTATSINDLCEAMGIHSPSLYAAYGNKEKLYLQAVEHYMHTVGSLLWARLEEAGSAQDGVRNLLQGATQCLCARDETFGGCMIMLGATNDEVPALVSEMIKKVRADMLDMMRARLRRAIVEGELPGSTDIDRVSRLYLSILHGMAVQARDGASEAELAGVAEAALALWPAPKTA